MNIYNNTSSLYELLSRINNISKTNENILENMLIERTLKTIESHEIKNVGDNAFCNCTNLTTASFPSCTTISDNAFYNCTNLTTIYLMGSSVCALAHSSAFTNTNITSIFVPASLVTSYKTATNWTYFSNKIYSGE